MSVETPERILDHPLDADAQAPPGSDVPPEEAPEGGAPEDLVNVPLTCAATFLATAAAGWMAAGLFPGVFPRLVGIAGAAIGVGVVAGSFRTSRPSIVQYLALPISIVAGALLVIPDASGGTANLPSLVAEAIRTGGVAQPPVPFDPGWRFILLVLTAFLGSAAASLATGLNRPRLGLLIPMPLLVGAALIQPAEATMVSSVVALVLGVAGLAVSYGVELAREGATSGGFELRRLARGAGALVVLVAVLVVLSRAGFLFPETDRDQVIPPTKPEVQPPQADRVLFEVVSDRPGPWRLGVLDVYGLEEQAWLLPPYDTTRFQEIGGSGAIPAPPAGREDTPTPGPASEEEREPYEVTFRIADVEGHVLPTVAEPAVVDRRTDFALQFDPRTQMLRLPQSRASAGMTYTVSAPSPPTGEQLAQAPQPPEAFEQFLEMPPAPLVVQDLLNEAPTENQWDRLQFVRDSFYQQVVAAGAGEPVDVPPFRVEEMLEGGEATPYEITAAEVMLARWAGIPARIGYGFYAGEKDDPGATTWEVRPKHGATWLEAYYDGYGWVPIIGKPPKAKASTSDEEKQQDPEIRPSDELALVVYVPIKLQSIRLLYTLIRYYLLVTLPFLAGALLVYGLFPYPIKIVRRYLRRRWADQQGPLEQIVAAYAEFRDMAEDHNIGDTVKTPLEFLSHIEPDAEHTELAWLVTRGMWGDLLRDLRTTDAEAAQDMARSVNKRVRVAQPAITRFLAMGSRSSLRDPYSAEIPNLWPSWLRRGLVRRGVGHVLRTLTAPLRRVRRLVPIGTSVLLVALLLGGCGRGEAGPVGASELPEPLVPDELSGYVFQRESEAETSFQRAGSESLVEADGRVYTVRKDTEVLGSLQAAVFKRELRIRDEDTREEVFDAIKSQIGSGQFESKRIGAYTIEEMELPEQRIFLWMPPDAGFYQLFIARQGFQEADRVFASVLAYQQGDDPALIDPSAGLPDPRRGVPE